MEHPAERQLLAFLTQAMDVSGSVWRQNGTAERLLAELIGGHAYDRRGALRGPDILISRSDDTPIAVEVKISRSSSFAKNINNRVADLLAQAVETRRSFRDEVTLGAILLFVEPQDHALGERDSALMTSTIRRLLRQEDGVGYDSVLLGVAGDQLRWRHFAPSDISSLTEANTFAFSPASEAFAAMRAQSSATPTRVPSRPRDRRRRILLVADEWRSSRGGVSTLNRELAVALVAAGIDAAVMVPRASHEDLKAASEADVALVTPARVPGLSDRELLLLRPVFAEADWEPDFLVGHGRVLGPYAAALQQQFFPDARRIHFVHTAAEELEAAKETLGGDSNMARANERRGLERDLAQSADLVVGVGPLLTATIRDELMGPGQEPRVTCFVPGLRDGFVVDPVRAPVRNTVLFVGRADDFPSKGIDIAAEALLTITDRWPRSEPHTPVLVVRGVPTEAASTVKKRLDEIFEGRVTYHLRPYVDSEADIIRDLAQAKMVLMPSRHEGFGLAAHEAISSGVPVLLGANSGLALFLRESGLDTFPSSIVTTRDSATHLATEDWVSAIERILSDAVGARANAAQLRRDVARVVTWSRSVATLLEELDSL